MISTEYEYLPNEVRKGKKRDFQLLSETKNSEGGWDYGYVDVDAFIVPCGVKFISPRYNKGDALNHMAECRVCKIVTARSRAKVLYQDEVVLAWALINWDGRTSNNNMRVSYDGNTVMHYQTISHLRIENGDILKNREDWSAGFSRVTHLYNGLEKASLPLSTLRGMNVKLRSIEILDHEKTTSFMEKILFKAYKNHADEVSYFLFAWDEQWFISELYDEPQTLHEAYESMKPELVKAFDGSFSPVYRQGDLFFVPTGLKNEDFEEIKKAHFRPYEGWQDKSRELVKCQIRINPRVIEGIGLDWSMSNHFSNRMATMGDDKVYVQGNITHPQHRQLKLGYDTWYLVVENRTIENFSLGGGID